MKKILILLGVVILIGIIVYPLVNYDYKSKEKEIINLKTNTEEINATEIKEEKIVEVQEKKKEEPIKEETVKSEVSQNKTVENKKKNIENKNKSNIKKKGDVSIKQDSSSKETVQPKEKAKIETPQVEKTCEEKKFLFSWFRADFEDNESCMEEGKKYVEKYAYACSYHADDCGKVWYMLRLTDEDGNSVNYHDIK